MRNALLAVLVSCVGACGGLRRAAEPLVDLNDVYTNAILDIRYATDNNFTRQVVYPRAKCALRKSVAERLAAAGRDMEKEGYRLKVYDCYRPISVQKIFWSLVPDPRYVADPKEGSRHNRGAAVDVTMTDANGVDLEMPSEFDSFTERAHRDWPNSTPEAKRNMKRLERIMLKHGFIGLDTEWWHFDSMGWKKYPLEDVPLESVGAR